jgi:prophage maintenance system killer protein
VTRYLSVPQLLFIHARLLAETGGSAGLRDLGLLEAAAARPQATFDQRVASSQVALAEIAAWLQAHCVSE